MHFFELLASWQIANISSADFKTGLKTILTGIVSCSSPNFQLFQIFHVSGIDPFVIDTGRYANLPAIYFCL
jgi:hypothetical protein